MEINYIYLLQEREFINTNNPIYKIGRTKQEHNKRFNQYPKGSILLFQIICYNCINMEKNVITIFKKNFKHRKDIGNEYFEGNSKEMIKDINNIINNEVIEESKENNEVIEENNENCNIKKEESDEEIRSDEYQQKALLKVIDNIKLTFKNYIDDKSFGGNKKFIKIEKVKEDDDDNYYYCSFINPFIKFIIFSKQGNIYDYTETFKNNNNIKDKNEASYQIIEKTLIYVEEDIEHIYRENNGDYYFKKILLKKNIIKIDKIYNLYDIIEKINKTKINININYYDEFKIFHNIIENEYTYYNNLYIRKQLNKLFNYNAVINNKIYGCTNSVDNTIKFKKMKDFDNIYIHYINNHINGHCGNSFQETNNSTKIYKLNNKYYCYYSFLRKYIPYNIRYDDNENFYLLNRDYEYIGLNIKYIKYDCKGSIYLYNDCLSMYKDNFIEMCNKYLNFIKINPSKKCINPCYINDILQVLN